MNSSSAVTEPIHENKTTTEKSVSTSQVTIFVPGSNNVRIEVDDSVHYNTNKVTLPLTPGMHHLKITRDGYQTVDRSFEVLAIAKQELPAVTLQAIINPEAPKSIQTPVAAQPASEQPAVLFQEPLLPEISPRVTTTDESGITLTQSEERTLKSAIDTILRSDWDASPKVAVAHAELHRAASARFAQWEPRLDHAYGLLLWHHGEMRKARDAMTEAVKREQTRPGRRIPYYALYRDKIRLQIVTDEEAKATEGLLDLARDTAGTLKSYPGMGFHEARQNADFIGRMMGFLEGPSHARVAHEVNLRLLSSRIEESFPSSELQEAYKSARMELRSQYEKERAQVEALQQARVARQRALQDSGELGRTNIRVKNSRFNGKRDRSDYGNLPALPIRVSAGSNVFATEKGTVEFFNGAAADYRPNPLFISGPAISRSYFNNRTNGTIRDKRKVALEELPKISSRRPQSLTTYVPQELERKRRQILESVNRSNADAE